MHEIADLGSLEERLLDPTVRASKAAVADLLDDDFVEYGSAGGIYDKAQVVDGLAAETPVARTVSDLTVRELAPDLGLVTYRVTRHGEPETHSLRSSVWRRTDGRWRLLFHQGTPV
jgi:hypothetical protein